MIKTAKIAIIIAHPGHELFVTSWLKNTSVLTFVLTDGSGRASTSRIDSTRELIKKCSGQIGSVFGKYRDVEFYDLVLAKNTEEFVEIAKSIAKSLEHNDINTVIGDPYEQQYLAHDLCRYLIDAAVLLVEKRTGNRIKNLHFPVYGNLLPTDTNCISREQKLDRQSVDWKLACAKRIPGEDIQEEISRLITERGMSWFSTETLVDVSEQNSLDFIATGLTGYELAGEELVREGYYKHVIRYEEHVKPIQTRLREYCENS